MYNRNNPYLHPSTSHVVGLNGNEILLHHHGHHIDFLPGAHYLTTGVSNAPVLEASALFNDINGPNGRSDPCTMSMFPRKQTGAKKDRHSKINTAQGPRDRRVRLSIGIARKFFDLQEMLGFDKPSKTLDWLLTKSKMAIKDLVQMKSCKSNNSTSGPNSDCHDQEVESSNSKGKSVVANNNTNNKVNLVKESRAKARARARERTKEKMSIKQQLNEANRYIKGNYHNQFEVSGSHVPNIHCPLSYEEATRTTTHEELIQEESMVIKRRLKQLHPPIFGFHQQNVNTSTIPSANVHENWDFSAILDHHNKFIN